MAHIVCVKRVWHGMGAWMGQCRGSGAKVSMVGMVPGINSPSGKNKGR